MQYTFFIVYTFSHTSALFLSCYCLFTGSSCNYSSEKTLKASLCEIKYKTVRVKVWWRLTRDQFCKQSQTDWWVVARIFWALMATLRCPPARHLTPSCFSGAAQNPTDQTSNMMVELGSFKVCNCGAGVPSQLTCLVSTCSDLNWV